MKRILVIRFSSLGDVILSTSILKPMYEAGYDVDFLTFKPFDQIFTNDYRINKVLSPEKKDLKGLSILKFRENLKNYDLIIDLHKNLRSLVLTYSSKTVRYKKNSLKRRLYVYPVIKRFLKDSFNVVKAYNNTLEVLGIRCPDCKPQIIITEEEKAKAKKDLPDKFIVLGTGARYKNKIYKKYDKVSEILLKKGYDVVLVGSTEDKKRDRTIYPEKVLDLRGKLSIRESLSVISNAVLTISNDSAVAHMSRAVGVPVSMIYGATHPYFGFAPFSDEGVYILKNISCQPCDLHGKKECKKGNTECLDIPPELIVEKSLSTVK
ncbi:glycosyltransferase family 9 protein [Persephonella sp.]